MPYFGKMVEPFEHGEKDMESYLKKTSLSPWVPVSDAVARKMMDVAQAGPTDVHVDLGSGDGRVNFHAIDYGVGRSIGIDVDEAIVQVARDRLAKRHPPPDLQFIVADLLDPHHQAWEKVQEASIITMYFAMEALEDFRPLLEVKLAGRQCKVICVGVSFYKSTAFSQDRIYPCPCP
jgi:SAM-dependent methyltransferase